MRREEAVVVITMGVYIIAIPNISSNLLYE